MLADQVYIAAMVALAGQTPVGKTWLLDRGKVKLDLGIADSSFDDIQRQIEARLPGKWDKATGVGKTIYVYKRIE